MKAILSTLLILLIASSADPEWISLERNGMVVKYRFVDDAFELEMHSPRQGWVAVGFNPRPGLTDTHLVMGCVKAGQVQLSERHVVRPGQYPDISSLGGAKAVELYWGSEDVKGTTIGFRLPADFSDRYRHSLSKGKSLHLTLAYSMEDDFLHHSTMRTSIQITL